MYFHAFNHFCITLTYRENSSFYPYFKLSLLPVCVECNYSKILLLILTQIVLFKQYNHDKPVPQNKPRRLLVAHILSVFTACKSLSTPFLFVVFVRSGDFVILLGFFCLFFIFFFSFQVIVNSIYDIHIYI